ncbi:MAG: SPOR domain-containing protein [Chlorobi bacterium]|nr:SPOR domain-containing protein [Chlorobiota bacterium]
MHEGILDALESLSADYAAPSREEEHFQLDRLDRYPGRLPFSPTVEAVTSESPGEALRISSALASVLAEDIERGKSARGVVTDDPLDRLAQQLDEVHPLIEAEPIASEPTIESSPIEDLPIEDETTPQQPQPATTEPQTPKSSRRRGRYALLIGILVIATASIIVIAPRIASHRTPVQQPTATTTELMTTRTPSKLSATASVDTPTSRDTTSHTDVTQKAIPLDSHRTSPATEHSDRAAQSHSLDRSPLPTIVKNRTATRRNQIADVSAESNTESVTIVKPPSLEYPVGKALFTLQVCSTPSYSEATRWKQLLQQNGKFDVTIVERRIRDGIYYRVRAGLFRSEAEARRAAVELGLNPAAVWIVRIE